VAASLPAESADLSMATPNLEQRPWIRTSPGYETARFRGEVPLENEDFAMVASMAPSFGLALQLQRPVVVDSPHSPQS
jgi:hypothetical protein